MPSGDMTNSGAKRLNNNRWNSVDNNSTSYKLGLKKIEEIESYARADLGDKKWAIEKSKVYIYELQDPITASEKILIVKDLQD